jgi:hypothetical protein
MTCEQFERVLPELGDSHSIEQELHLKSCSACSELLSDLNAIARQARLLEPDVDPSPRVWNSVEITLRHEGLIGQPEREHSPSSALTPLSWRFRWLLPLAAAFLVAFGVLLHQQKGSRSQVASQESTKTVDAIPYPSDSGSLGPEDQKLLTTITDRTPSMRAAYETNLRTVNGYVRDAELLAKRDPNDQDAQRYLMNAYEQKAMVYEMALDRSLP